MSNKIKDIRTMMVPVFHDWDLRSMWKLIQDNIYEDESGKLQSRPLERQPDGEPSHWDIVLLKGEKSYCRTGHDDCNCDLSSGEMCPHWKLLN